jgi:hypothetical protein
MIANALRRILAAVLVVAMVAAPLSQMAAWAGTCEPEPVCQMGSSCCCAAAVEAVDGNSAITKKGCDCEISESEPPAEPPLRAAVTKTTDASPADTSEPRATAVLTHGHRSTLAQNHGPPGEHSTPRYISNCSFLI